MSVGEYIIAWIGAVLVIVCVLGVAGLFFLALDAFARRMGL